VLQRSEQSGEYMKKTLGFDEPSIGGVKPISLVFTNLAQMVLDEKDPNYPKLEPEERNYVEKVFSGIADNVVKEGQSANYSFVGIRQQLVQAYRKEYGQEAYEETIAELGDKADPLTLQDTVEDKILDKIPNRHLDVVAKHPHISSLVVDLLVPGSTSMLAKGGKALRLATKAVGLGDKVRKVEETASNVASVAADKLDVIGKWNMGGKGRNLGSAFNARYNVDLLARKAKKNIENSVGEGATTDMAASLSLTREKSYYYVNELKKVINKNTRALDKILKTKDEKALYMAAVEGRGLQKIVTRTNKAGELVKRKKNYKKEVVDAMVERNPNVKRALESSYHNNLQNAHHELRVQAGANQRWKTADEVITTESGKQKVKSVTRLTEGGKYAEGTFVPHEIMLNQVTARQTNIVGSNNLKGVTPSSQFARKKTKTPSTLKVKQDVAEQWRARMAKEQHKLVASDQIRQSDEIMRKYGQIERVTVRNRKELNAAIEEKSRKTGQPWVALEPTLDNVWTRITGEPGVIRGRNRNIIPEAAVPFIEELVVMAKPRDYNGALKAAKDFVGFSTRLFSRAQTLPWPQFYGAQQAGNMLISYQALGTKAFNIRNQYMSYVGSIANAFEDPAKFAKFSMRALDGSERPADYAVKEMRRRGYVAYDKLDDVDAAAALQRSGISKLEENVNAVIGKTPLAIPGKVARAQDNQMKILIFNSFLESWNPVDIDKAVYKANKFVSNYNNLGWIEKDYLQNIGSFYGWARYGVLQLMPMVAKYPERFRQVMAVFAEAEQYYGGQAPYGAGSVQDDLAIRSVTAPHALQPPTQQENQKRAFYLAWDDYERAGRPAVGSQDFTMLAFENVVMSAIPVLQLVFGNDRQAAANNIVPAVRLATELWKARDLESPELVLNRFPTTWNQFQLSPYANFYKQYTERAKTTYSGLLDLYNDDPVAQTNFALKLNIANNMNFMTPYINIALSEESQLPEVPWYARGRIQNPTKAEMGRIKAVENAQSTLKATEKKLR